MKATSIAMAFMLAVPGLAIADSPQGKWSAPNGEFTIKLSQCGKTLCGNIVRLKEPTYANGKTKIDRHNENKSLRARPLIGLALLSDMKPSGQGSWEGKVYNPEDGQTYNATIMLRGGTIQLQGCVAGIFCKTEKFVRAH